MTLADYAITQDMMGSVPMWLRRALLQSERLLKQELQPKVEP